MYCLLLQGQIGKSLKTLEDLKEQTLCFVPEDPAPNPQSSNIITADNTIIVLAIVYIP
jgi:hypothetical protein